MYVTYGTGLSPAAISSRLRKWRVEAQIVESLWEE